MSDFDTARVNARIFIVDDEDSNLKLLDRLIASLGYRHRVLIKDPRQVFEKYAEQRPDLILLDINMPHMDGYEVMQKLNALDDPLLPPIVILTAQREKDYLLHALELGARDYVTKPFDHHELILRVRNSLQLQLVQRMLHDEKSYLDSLVRERTEELHHTRLEIVQRLGMAAEYRDEETGNHILRMSHTCQLLADAIGWDEEQCDLILNASPMHDIGKIGIPDSILLKPGKLDSAEWKTMRTHTTIGGKLLDGDDSTLMIMARDIALTHHEKWDGSGYPTGLSGEDIPLAGRIAAICDVFDALTSERPYKKAWAVEDAVTLIKDNKGKHFDPELVGVFIDLLPEILEIREKFSEPSAA